MSGPYFPAFGLNSGKYGTDITPCLDTFHAVVRSGMSSGQTFDDFIKSLSFRDHHLSRKDSKPNSM